MTSPQFTSWWLAALFAVGAAAQEAAPDPAGGEAGQDPGQQRYALRFEPPADRVLAVTYAEDNAWDYPDSDMKGELRTELTMHWRFAPHERGRLAVGTFEAVAYVGRGHKKGEDFDHDVRWSREQGYRSGEGSKADATWIAREVEAGVRLAVDARGAADPGEC